MTTELREWNSPLGHRMLQGGSVLEGNYELKFGGQAVGRVQVTREGLYYRFYCRCRMPGDGVCRVLARWEDTQESLGILVPAGDGFGLDTRMATKKAGQGKPEFTVIPNRAKLRGKFIPIKPEEPFSYIARLKDAYLACHEGQIGAVIKEEAGT